MPLYGALSASTLGMMSQTYALNVIGKNVANVTTGGYKRDDVNFQSVLSKNLFNQGDLGGALPNTYQRISNQGQLQGTQRELDLAINGRGFFIMSDSLTDTSNPIYTRDGSFETRIDSSGSTDEGYLVDKNGYYVLGVAAGADGTFSSSGTLVPIRIDSDAFSSNFQATTATELDVNLPANLESISAAGASAAQQQTDHLNAVTQFNDGTRPDNFEFYNIEVVDSAGTLQSVRLNFTKHADNSWLVSATTSQTPTAQVDTVTLDDTDGAIEAGDVFTLSVGSSTFTYTATGAEADINAVRSGLIALVNGDSDAAATAAVGTADGEFTLTAKTAGEAFTSGITVTEPAAVAQVDTATLAGTVGALEAGDVYNISITTTSGTFTASYTTTGAEATINDVRTGLLAALPAVTGATVAAGGGAGEITVTSTTAGSAITTTTSATNNGATADNTFATVTTVANVAQDNQASAATTTTANVLSVQTTTPQSLTFTSTGLAGTATVGAANGVTPPDPLSFTTGFQATGGDTTATFTIDFSGTTQFAGDFTPTLYTKNGFAAAELTGISFDSSGHVIGSFDDSTFRELYKIPLADFVNADGLMEMNGMTFMQSATSGSSRVVFADETSIASFLPSTVELSNVDIADQFSKMIITQNAYNTNATVFRTVDEMTEVVRDLKR
jgi:flagellar hook-basal body protein